MLAIARAILVQQKKKFSINFSKTEISLFVKGLNLSLPPHSFNFENHLLPFELLYRDVTNGEKKYHDAVVHSKSKLKDIALSSFRLYNRKDCRSEN